MWPVITVYKLREWIGGLWKGIWKNRIEVSRWEIMGDCFSMQMLFLNNTVNTDVSLPYRTQRWMARRRRRRKSCFSHVVLEKRVRSPHLACGDLSLCLGGTHRQRWVFSALPTPGVYLDLGSRSCRILRDALSKHPEPVDGAGDWNSQRPKDSRKAQGRNFSEYGTLRGAS